MKYPKLTHLVFSLGIPFFWFFAIVFLGDIGAVLLSKLLFVLALVIASIHIADILVYYLRNKKAPND